MGGEGTVWGVTCVRIGYLLLSDPLGELPDTYILRIMYNLQDNIQGTRLPCKCELCLKDDKPSRNRYSCPNIFKTVRCVFHL